MEPDRRSFHEGARQVIFRAILFMLNPQLRRKEEDDSSIFTPEEVVMGGNTVFKVVVDDTEFDELYQKWDKYKQENIPNPFTDENTQCMALVAFLKDWLKNKGSPEIGKDIFNILEDGHNHRELKTNLLRLRNTIASDYYRKNLERPNKKPGIA